MVLLRPMTFNFVTLRMMVLQAEWPGIDDANAGLAHYWRWVQLPKSYNKRTFYQVKTSSEVLFRQPSSLRTSGTSTTPAPSRLACPEDYTCDARGARGRAWRGMCGKAVRPVSMSSM